MRKMKSIFLLFTSFLSIIVCQDQDDTTELDAVWDPTSAIYWDASSTAEEIEDIIFKYTVEKASAMNFTQWDSERQLQGDDYFCTGFLTAFCTSRLAGSIATCSKEITWWFTDPVSLLETCTLENVCPHDAWCCGCVDDVIHQWIKWWTWI
eukprot:GFUD01023283.1.p1 GENE.GFUD01023283.1~~GFUD01023283.1.p1  ORF type:complete len:151 (+),score=5.96 GFUD01023283.1:57-509(+)